MASEIPKVYFLKAFGHHGSREGEFGGPFGIHIAKGAIYIADDLNHVIQIFDLDGNFLKKLGRHGTRPGEFAYLDCVITDASGFLYVADTGNNRLQILNPSGKPHKVIRHFGWLKNFKNPRDISFNPAGRLFVTDWGNHCIRVFSKEGKFLFSFGRKGRKPGFENPITLTHSKDGKVYISDFKNHRVQVFNLEGRFLFSFGQEGSGKGDFRHPSGLALILKGGFMLLIGGITEFKYLQQRVNF